MKPWQKVPGLIFPCEEDAYEHESAMGFHLFDDDGYVQSLNHESGQLEPLSTWGSILVLFALW